MSLQSLAKGIALPFFFLYFEGGGVTVLPFAWRECGKLSTRQLAFFHMQQRNKDRTDFH
jgi:hypothetical protein